MADGDITDEPIQFITALYSMELLEALKDMVAQYRCAAYPCWCKTCKRTIEYEKLIARAEGKET